MMPPDYILCFFFNQLTDLKTITPKVIAKSHDWQGASIRAPLPYRMCGCRFDIIFSHDCILMVFCLYCYHVNEYDITANRCPLVLLIAKDKAVIASNSAPGEGDNLRNGEVRDDSGRAVGVLIFDLFINRMEY